MKFRFTSNRFFNCRTNQSDFTIFHDSWNQTKFQSPIFRLLDETKNRLIFFAQVGNPYYVLFTVLVFTQAAMKEQVTVIPHGAH